MTAMTCFKRKLFGKRVLSFERSVPSAQSTGNKVIHVVLLLTCPYGQLDLDRIIMETGGGD